MGKKAVVIGRGPHGAVQIDLEILLRTRLLIQANSGGGKSWLLRRLAEQFFGRIPVFIIDPEGEFASLREKHAYVLVGAGGDTPADVRSAALVAERLLELRASAVFDLYEAFRKNPQGRHEWVKRFLEALLDAPKKLWRPLIVIIDEAHTFCPEQGDSVAENAMIGLATAGRKRGFCPVWATQRLALLNKSASSQLMNRLVGNTFEDVDIDRAVDLLSVSKDERHEFKKEIKVLVEGHFHAIGRAISRDRVLVKVGPVFTTHPEPGMVVSEEPPPPPDKVREMLPKLTDLPKEAEEKAKTTAEFKARIRQLEQELRARPSPAAAAPAIEYRDRPMIPPEDLVKLKGLMDGMCQIGATIRNLANSVDQSTGAFEVVRDGFAKRIQALAPATAAHASQKPEPAVTTKFPPQAIRTPMHPADLRHLHEVATEGKDDQPSPKQRLILKALADFCSIGRNDVPRKWVAARAIASHKSSTFTNNLGALRSRGLIDYGPGGTIHLTPIGSGVVEIPPAPPSPQEMLSTCLKLLTPKMQSIMNAAFVAYPGLLSKEDAAHAAESSISSSTFGNYLGALRSAGMIDYVDGGLKCADWIAEAK